MRKLILVWILGLMSLPSSWACPDFGTSMQVGGNDFIGKMNIRSKQTSLRVGETTYYFNFQVNPKRVCYSSSKEGKDEIRRCPESASHVQLTDGDRVYGDAEIDPTQHTVTLKRNVAEKPESGEARFSADFVRCRFEADDSKAPELIQFWNRVEARDEKGLSMGEFEATGTEGTSVPRTRNFLPSSQLNLAGGKKYERQDGCKAGYREKGTGPAAGAPVGEAKSGEPGASSGTSVAPR